VGDVRGALSGVNKTGMRQDKDHGVCCRGQVLPDLFENLASFFFLTIQG